MRPEPRAVLAVSRELVVRQPVAEVERRIEREARVALREHEPVAVGVARVVDLEDVRVERRDDVRDGERRADVTDARPHGLLEHDAADPVAQGRRSGFNSRQGQLPRAHPSHWVPERARSNACRPAFKPIAEVFPLPDYVESGMRATNPLAGASSRGSAPARRRTGAGGRCRSPPPTSRRRSTLAVTLALAREPPSRSAPSSLITAHSETLEAIWWLAGFGLVAPLAVLGRGAAAAAADTPSRSRALPPPRLVALLALCARARARARRRGAAAASLLAARLPFALLLALGRRRLAALAGRRRARAWPTAAVAAAGASASPRSCRAPRTARRRRPRARCCWRRAASRPALRGRTLASAGAARPRRPDPAAARAARLGRLVPGAHEPPGLLPRPRPTTSGTAATCSSTTTRSTASPSSTSWPRSWRRCRSATGRSCSSSGS